MREARPIFNYSARKSRDTLSPGQSMSVNSRCAWLPWIMALLVMSSVGTIQAAMPEPLRQAIVEAVNTNPEVQKRWHAFLAAEEGRGVARGRYYPEVDLRLSAARQWQDSDAGRFDRDPLSATLTLNQMLYDGFFTRSDVRRLGHARLVRYYELLEAAETAALEAVRAYADVERYRELAFLAEENYRAHQALYEQVDELTRTGVGRGVDLEQATGRLALAESNLLTEVANLHDVTARFLRVVGRMPTDDFVDLIGVLPDGSLPETAYAAQVEALATNPALFAAVENILSAQQQVSVGRSYYHPRLDFQIRQSRDNALSSTFQTGEGDWVNDTTAGLVLSLNLFRGFADQSRIGQFVEETNVAKDELEIVCRNVRQEVTIAFHDVQVLDERLRYLDQHQLSSDRVRTAYRQQFGIGQRSLLDLLDAENEFFVARREFVDGQFDREIALARTYAGLGRLLPVLEIVRDTMPEISEVTTLDPERICPPLGDSGDLKTPARPPAIVPHQDVPTFLRREVSGTDWVAPPSVEPPQPASPVRSVGAESVTEDRAEPVTEDVEAADGFERKPEAMPWVPVVTAVAPLLLFNNGGSDGASGIRPPGTPGHALGAQGRASLQTMRLQMQGVGRRLEQLRLGQERALDDPSPVSRVEDSLSPVSSPGVGLGGGAGDLVESGRTAVFVSGSTILGRRSGTSGEPTSDENSLGLTAGVDYRLTPTAVVGLAIGMSGTDVEFRDDSGEVDVDGYSLSLYGMHYASNLHVDGMLYLGRNKHDTARGILQDTNGQSAISRPTEQAFGLGLGTGYDLVWGPRTTSLLASVDYRRGRIDAFEEVLANPGGPGSDSLLAVERQTVDSLTTELAVQMTYAYPWRGGVLLPTARVGVEHELRDDSRDVWVRFVNGAEGPFAVNTGNPDRTYVNLGLGLSAQFTHGRSAFLFVETVEGKSGVREQRIDAGFRMEF